MLINLTNHPYKTWDEKQKLAAQKFGEVIDWDFPVIDPSMSGVKVKQVASEICAHLLDSGKIEQEYIRKTLWVHIQGEQVFVFQIVTLLLEKGIPCLASTSERRKINLGNGKSEQYFQFVQFRTY